MKTELRYYLVNRLRVIDHLVLAAFFGLILFEIDDSIFTWGKGIAFFFCSLLLFRLLDDLGVRDLDTADHPERSYLFGRSYKFLQLVLLCVIPIYLLIAFVFYGRIPTSILMVFLFTSIVIYYLFGKKRRLLTLLPFTKYPLLLVLLSPEIEIPNTYLSGLGLMTMMMAYDYIEKRKKIWSMVLVLSSGFLHFFTFPLMLGLSFTLLICVLILLRFHSRNVKFFPLIYFPSTIFLLKYLIRINFF